jgi:hypothetical protein
MRRENGARFQIRAQFAGALVRALVIVFLRERAPGVRPFAFRRPRDSWPGLSARLDSTIVKQKSARSPREERGASAKQPYPSAPATRLPQIKQLPDELARASRPFFRARGRMFHRDRVTFSFVDKSMTLSVSAPAFR